MPRRQQLGRPGGLAPRAQIAVAERGRRVRQSAGGPGDPGRQPVGDQDDTPIRATATAVITAHDASDAAGNLGRGQVDLVTAARPAERHRLEHDVAAGHRRRERLGRGRGRAQVGVAGVLGAADEGPAAQPVGRPRACQVDGELPRLARLGAVDGALSVARLVLTASTGSMAAPASCADVNARSRATSRTMIASGSGTRSRPSR